jgi:WD40 repeat protein
VLKIAYSPNGELIAVGQEDGTISFHDGKTAEQVAVLGHHSGLRSLAYSPDGDLIATGSGDHSVKLWRVPGSLQSNESPLKSNAAEHAPARLKRRIP